MARQVRRLPFGLREKADKNLNELLEMEIIKEVPEGPTGTLSLFWSSQKKMATFECESIFVGLTKLAITRERHPVPTVEVVLHTT